MPVAERLPAIASSPPDREPLIQATAVAAAPAAPVVPAPPVATAPPTDAGLDPRGRAPFNGGAAVAGDSDPAMLPARPAPTRPPIQRPPIQRPQAAGPADMRPAPEGVDSVLERTATAPQLRRFIKSRAYVPMHELRRRFAINGADDEVTPVDLERHRVFVGLPEREGRLLGELLRGGDIGYELSLDPISPIVVGVYPMRPVTRS
jgi:hypothetical protein